MRMRRVGVGAWGAVALTVSALFWPSAVQAQVKLEYKFPEGRKLQYRSTTETSQVLTIMGQDIETKAKETVVTSSSVGKKRGDATVPVEERIDSIASDLSLPGGISLSYDTNDPNAKIEDPRLTFLADVYKLLSGMAYTVVLDGQNKVKAVEGTEKLLEKADKLAEPAKQSIRGRLESQKLKSQFEQAHGNLPEVLARPGEPWEKTDTLDIGNGQTLTFRKKYEYQGTEKKGAATLDKIGVKTLDVKFAMDPNSPSPLKAVKSDLKIDSGDGTILFDREGGNIVSAKGKTRIKGKITFSAGGQEIPADLDLTFDSSTELVSAK